MPNDPVSDALTAAAHEMGKTWGRTLHPVTPVSMLSARVGVLAFLRAVQADHRWPSDEQAAAGDMADRLEGKA